MAVLNTQHATGLKTGDRKFGGTPTCRSDDDEGAREVRTVKRITKQQKRGHHLKKAQNAQIVTYCKPSHDTCD